MNLSVFKLMKYLSKWEEQGVFERLDLFIEEMPKIYQRLSDMEELLQKVEHLDETNVKLGQIIVQQKKIIEAMGIGATNGTGNGNGKSGPATKTR